MNEDLLRYDNDKTLVFIDCETENLCLSFDKNLPWQIALIKMKGNKRIGEKDFHVKWPQRDIDISEEAARITRFNYKSYISKAIPFDEISEIIFDWLDGADHIVGHNILGFDLYLIREMYRHCGKDPRHLTDKIIDTVCIARGIKTNHNYKKGTDFLEYQYRMLHLRKKGLRNKLEQLGREYDIDHNYDMLHDALNDLDLNVKVWNKLKYQIEL